MKHDDMRPSRLDPSACRAALRDAVTHADVLTDDHPTRRQRVAAFALAVAVGRCELFGVWPRPASLARPILMATAVELAERFRSLAADADRRADPAFLIERRLHAWAAYLAVEDGLGDELSPVLDAADACDAALDRLGPTLARATSDHRIRAWADALVTPYRTLPPWWLSTRPTR